MKGTFRKEKKFSSDEISVFCDQIAMLLNGGIPLYEGVYILYSEMEDNQTKEILKQIDESMKSGVSFYLSLKKTQAFPEYMIHMLQVGETTGKLEDVMHSLSSYYERESYVKASIRSAVTYPAVLFAMMAIILLVLVFKILPLFEAMYNELNVDIVSSSSNMMTFGINAGIAMAVLVTILVIFVFALMLWYRTKNGEKNLKSALNKMTITKKLTEMMATGKFISSMALMISTGIETREALDLASGSSDNQEINNRIKDSIHMVEDGMSLDSALRESKLIVGLEGRMVSVAAKSGASDTVFTKLSEQYNMKITTALSKISTYFETILVVALAVMLGTVLISVMLPLVNIISSIG